MIELKETKHNYYCSDTNLEKYETWDDFKSEWLEKDLIIDCDYNLCFRYDILQKQDVVTNELLQEYELWLFFMLQRKGRLTSVIVEKIEETDMPEIEKFLKFTWEYHKNQWKEIIE